MPPSTPTHIEQTFVLIKPEGLRRRLFGAIVQRFENRELTLRCVQLMTASRSLAEAHYHVHSHKPFFSDLVDLVTSGPVIAMVWEGEHAIRLCRMMAGPAEPFKAEPGTIRGDFASNALNSLIHVSDSPDTAVEEIKLWFPEGVDA